MLTREQLERIQTQFYDAASMELMSDPVLITSNFDKNASYTRVYDKATLDGLFGIVAKDYKEYDDVQKRTADLMQIMQGRMSADGRRVEVAGRDFTAAEVKELEDLEKTSTGIEQRLGLKKGEKVHKVGVVKDPLNPNIQLSADMPQRDGKIVMALAYAAAYKSITENDALAKTAAAKDIMDYYKNDAKKIKEDMAILEKFAANPNDPTLKLTAADHTLLTSWGVTQASLQANKKDVYSTVWAKDLYKNIGNPEQIKSALDKAALDLGGKENLSKHLSTLAQSDISVANIILGIPIVTQQMIPKNFAEIAYKHRENKAFPNSDPRVRKIYQDFLTAFINEPGQAADNLKSFITLEKIGLTGYFKIQDPNVRKTVVDHSINAFGGIKQFGEWLNNHAKVSAENANLVFQSNTLANHLHPMDVAKISVQFSGRGFPNSIDPTINNNFNVSLLRAARASADAALIILKSKDLTDKIPDKEWTEILKIHAAANPEFTKAVNDLNKPYPHVTLLVARTILARKAEVAAPVPAKPLLMGGGPVPAPQHLITPDAMKKLMAPWQSFVNGQRFYFDPSRNEPELLRLKGMMDDIQQGKPVPLKALLTVVNHFKDRVGDDAKHARDALQKIADPNAKVALDQNIRPKLH